MVKQQDVIGGVRRLVWFFGLQAAGPPFPTFSAVWPRRLRNGLEKLLELLCLQLKL